MAIPLSLQILWKLWVWYSMYNFQCIIGIIFLIWWLARQLQKKIICDVLPGPYISDHLPVQFSIQMIREQPKKWDYDISGYERLRCT